MHIQLQGTEGSIEMRRCPTLCPEVTIDGRFVDCPVPNVRFVDCPMPNARFGDCSVPASRYTHADGICGSGVFSIDDGQSCAVNCDTGYTASSATILSLNAIDVRCLMSDSVGILCAAAEYTVDEC